MTDFEAIAASLEENLEVEEVSETPEVGPGDLLLLSHNTIHATQTTDDRRLAVTLRTCDPATPIDWHRVAGNPTPVRMKGLADQNPLSFPVFNTPRKTTSVPLWGTSCRP